MWLSIFIIFTRVVGISIYLKAPLPPLCLFLNASIMYRFN